MRVRSSAIPLFEQVLEAQRVKLGEDHRNTLITRGNLARAYAGKGRYQDAELLFRNVVESTGRSKPRNDRFYSGELASFGRLLIRQREYAEAVRVLRECLEIKEKTQPGDWTTAVARSLLGEALTGQRAFQAAEPLLLDAQKALSERREKSLPHRRDVTLHEAAERVIRLYEAWGKPQLANDWKKRLDLADLPADVFARP